MSGGLIEYLMEYSTGFISAKISRIFGSFFVTFLSLSPIIHSASILNRKLAENSANF